MRWLFFISAALSAAVAAKAQDQPTAAQAPSRGVAMQYGPLLSCTVEAPRPAQAAASGARPSTSPAPPSADNLARLLALQGLVIKVDATDEAYVCFDTESLRLAAAWSDGFLHLRDTNIGAYKGNRSGAAVLAGDVLFKTSRRAGWNLVGEGEASMGVDVPREQMKWNGVYLHGAGTVLSYRLAGCEVLESVELVRSAEQAGMVRHFQLAPSSKALAALILEHGSDRVPHVELLAGDQRALLVVQDGTTRLLIPPHEQRLRFSVLYTPSVSDGLSATARESVARTPDLESLRAGGPSRWPPIITSGSVAPNDAAYVVDAIEVPEENPWQSWMRLSAIDFFDDGRAAVATLNGDVWIVSGLDAKLERVTWKRFAVGFYEPMGLRVVGGRIHVHGRDQITRLHDLNGDDEADFYECFNADRPVYPSYHAFAFDLQTDRAGNFYHAASGAWQGINAPGHNCVIRVSPDGLRSEVVATGFRAPNGLTIGPRDEIIVSDNQGNWTPASKISVVRPGGFYGFVADPRVEPNAPAPPRFDEPLCWIPHALDNSSGGQVWGTGDRWGPLSRHLLHTSYGKAALFAVLPQELGGDRGAEAATRVPPMQGGVVALPLRFSSGIMRARFAPHDGQLYTVGLKGWQTAGAREGSLERVRYTGRPHHLPTGLRVEKNRVVLEFAVPLDAATAADPQNYALERWNYQWSSQYGSVEYSITRPGEKGRDTLEITRAEVSADQRSVALAVPDLRPAMQMLIKTNIAAADGPEIRSEIASTVHVVPE